MINLPLATVIMFIFYIFTPQAIAQDEILSEEIIHLRKGWSNANYALKNNQQKVAFEQLISTADVYINQNKDDAQGYIWRGIIKSSFAGAKGGLGALSLAKEAKKDLQHAINLNEDSLSGSAHTSLATLYAKVPGWPFGFGSNKKAQQHFDKALAINPEGIDPNYFYAEFLYEEKRQYKKAKQLLLKAKTLDPVKISPLADSERQKEIAALLIKVETK